MKLHRDSLLHAVLALIVGATSVPNVSIVLGQTSDPPPQAPASGGARRPTIGASGGAAIPTEGGAPVGAAPAAPAAGGARRPTLGTTGNAPLPPAAPTAPVSPSVGNNTPSGGVSFVRDIVPWMTSQCGGCHIDGAKGNYSLATYNALMSNQSVVPNDPLKSELVKIIEAGEMPKGPGPKVSPENITKLKTWITEGAKFDGNDPAASLRSLSSSPSNGPGMGGGSFAVEAPVETLRDRAVTAFRGGNTNRAIALYQAHALAVTSDEASELLNNYRWDKHRKTPRLGYSFAVGLVLKNPGNLTELKPIGTPVQSLRYSQAGANAGSGRGAGGPGGRQQPSANKPASSLEEAGGELVSKFISAFNAEHSEGAWSEAFREYDIGGGAPSSFSGGGAFIGFGGGSSSGGGPGSNFGGGPPAGFNPGRGGGGPPAGYNGGGGGPPAGYSGGGGPPAGYNGGGGGPPAGYSGGGGPPAGYNGGGGGGAPAGYSGGGGPPAGYNGGGGGGAPAGYSGGGGPPAGYNGGGGGAPAGYSGSSGASKPSSAAGGGAAAGGQGNNGGSGSGKTGSENLPYYAPQDDALSPTGGGSTGGFSAPPTQPSSQSSFSPSNLPQSRDARLAGGARALGPGLTFIGSSENANELVKKANADRYDGLVLFEVDVSLIRQNGMVKNDTRIRVLNLKAEKDAKDKVITSTTMNNREMAMDKQKDEKIDKAINGLIKRMKESYSLAELPRFPVDLITNKRIPHLEKDKERSKIDLLSEINLYFSLGVINDAEKTNAFEKILGVDGRTLSIGTPEQKLPIIEKLIALEYD